jgi:hypothetical protein
MDRITIGIATAIAFSGVTLIVADTRPDKMDIQKQDPPIAGIHWARGQRPARPSRSPNLVYHGGPVLHGTLVEPIFWGARWTDSTFVNDKISGVQTFYGGIGSSSYAQTNIEYTDSTGHVSASVSLGSTRFDFSDVTTNGQRTGPILSEVCANVPNPVSNGYYPVYVDLPRGRARFCAWHSAGTCPNGTTVQFAFFFNLDGDPGCDPQDTSGLHSQGLAVLANVSGHEISEALTDPHLNAWYDSNGEENADKCAWSFGTPLLTFHNGLQWKVQGNWSNAAFTNNTGYANRDGQNGCIDGGNFK